MYCIVLYYIIWKYEIYSSNLVRLEWILHWANVGSSSSQTWSLFGFHSQGGANRCASVRQNNIKPGTWMLPSHIPSLSWPAGISRTKSRAMPWIWRTAAAAWRSTSTSVAALHTARVTTMVAFWDVAAPRSCWNGWWPRQFPPAMASLDFGDASSLQWLNRSQYFPASTSPNEVFVSMYLYIYIYLYITIYMYIYIYYNDIIYTYKY